MSNRVSVLAALALACLGIYLFVSAPPPLAESPAPAADIPVERMLAAMQGANEAVRELWTREIVQAGVKSGLRFDERWRDADVQAGPLPALFLRETARSLERNPVQLSLFLGSDFPIEPSNGFEGAQLERFRVLRETGQPQFFYVPDTGLHTGMFADVAVTEACVDCHNEHEQAPKRDWRLKDVMGAVTWSYPAEAVTLEEFLRAVAALHAGFRDAYEAYIEEIGRFAQPPVVGDRWPRDGYYVPSVEVFMAEAYRRTAPRTLAIMTTLAERERPALQDPPPPRAGAP